MYCKLFASLYQGTLRGQSNEILVFTNLLAHCGKDGTVDKHYRAIAEETGLPIDQVKAAIFVLESADPESRSPEENGARIVKMDEHRAWGWRVVNYGKYRAIRSEDDRAEQNRLAQARWRAKQKGDTESVIKVSQGKPESAKVRHGKPKEKEKNKKEGESPFKGKPSNENEVTDYCVEISIPESDGKAMFARWEGNGFTNGGKPMKDWKATIRSWNLSGYLPSQKNGTRKSEQPTMIGAEEMAERRAESLRMQKAGADEDWFLLTGERR